MKKEKKNMLDSVIGYINRLSLPSGSQPAFRDDEIADAVASLFKQMVLADGVVRHEEVAAAMRGLAEKYQHLDTGEGPSITERFSDAKSETVYAIATVLNRSMTVEERRQLKQQLIAVAMADREFHEYENDFMQLVEKLIKG